MARNGDPADQPTDRHIWKFFRAGGFDQVRLDTGRDAANIGQLDQKLWVALACPTRGIEFDEATLDLIDGDHDGRIRAPDLIEAVQWTTRLLKDPEDLTKGRGVLPLDAIDTATDEGQQILTSARAMLRLLGKDDATEVTLDDVARCDKVYAAAPFNGDGVVPADVAEDPDTRAVIADIIACLGPDADRSDKPGVGQARVDQFFAQIAALAAWHAEAQAHAEILALGQDTEAAAASLHDLADKLDDYFTRCRLAAFDPRAGAALNPPLAAYEALATEQLDAARAELRALPLARIEAGRALPLGPGVNPAWSDALARFQDVVVTPLLGPRSELAEVDWETIKVRFAAHRDWLARKPTNQVEALGFARIHALARSDAKARIDDLIAKDKALEPEMSALSRVERLTRFQRDLLPLLNNVVSFRDFYTRNGKGMFQAGTLYMDGRSCELCVKVGDAAKHAELATLSRIYLAYCVCTRGAETQTIAAAFTNGDSDNLRVGRNGVFYDRKGRDWDASIIRIVEHPISLIQAFWLPYRQATRMLSEQAQKLATARAAAVQTQLAARAATVGATAAAPAAPAGAAAAAAPAAAPQPFDAARFAGIFAAIGLAIGAIGTAIASVVTGFLNLTWWQMPLAVLGVLLLISGPSMVIAAIKLRSRNIGPILDASGWAVNTRLRVTIPFGTALTALAKLPPGAQRSLTDPYAEKRPPWELYLGIAAGVAIVVGLWWFGVFDRWFG